MHRDVSSAIIHALVVACEVMGARLDHENAANRLNVTHERKYSETHRVKFYRPRVYLHYKHFRKVNGVRPDTQEVSTQCKSTYYIIYFINMILKWI